MSAFLTMISLYYMCDQAATHRAMTRPEVTACMANYERLKLEFIDEEPARIGSRERALQSRLGYRGFKAWETANPDIVQHMRQTARLRLNQS